MTAENEWRCDNCTTLPDFEPDAATSFAEVELLTLKSLGGTVGWEVSDVQLWCASCLRGAALLGATKLGGRETFGTERPRGERPLRVRLV